MKTLKILTITGITLVAALLLVSTVAAMGHRTPIYLEVTGA